MLWNIFDLAIQPITIFAHFTSCLLLLNSTQLFTEDFQRNSEFVFNLSRKFRLLTLAISCSFQNLSSYLISYQLVSSFLQKSFGTKEFLVSLQTFTYSNLALDQCAIESEVKSEDDKRRNRRRFNQSVSS